MNSNSNAEYFDEAPHNEGFKTKEIILKYLRYWPFVLISMILALSAAYIKNKFTPPTYQLESKFLIKEEDNTLGILDLTGLGSSKGPGSQGQRLANEAVIFKSKPLAEEVLGYLDFDVEYYVEGSLIKSEIYKNSPVKVTLDWEHAQLTEGFIKVTWQNDQTYTLALLDETYLLAFPGNDKTEPIEDPAFQQNSFGFGEWEESQLAKFKIDLVTTEKEGAIILKFRDKKSLVSQYSGDGLEVWPLDASSSILGLSLITNQPEKGQIYLNTLMKVYLDIELRDKTLIASNTVDFIDSQISGVADSLNFTGANLQNYRATNKTYNIDTEGNTIFTQLSELERTLSQEKYKQEYYSKLQEYLVREDYNEILMPSGLGIDDPILNTLIENLITLQAEKSRHLATQTEASPTVREANRKINDLNASIKEVLKNVNQNANYIINDLEVRIAKIEGEFSRLPTTEQNLLRFQRKFDLNENIYTFLLQRRAESAIAMASNTASNKIVEYAGSNHEPLAIKPLTNYLIAVALGSMFPMAIISLLIFFNDKIKDRKELEQNLNIPILTEIGHNRITSNLVVLKAHRSGIAEAFRSLRTNITFIVPKDKQLTIAVTSTIAGEGKSFSSMNLASAYSLSDKKTILIGCDLHKPKTFDDFTIENSIGLSTYLSKQIEDISTIIQPSSFPNLDVIVAGPIPPNPSELLANERFEQILDELKQKYDVIVLDTPPMGLASETLAIMKMVDLTLYVLRYNYSKYAYVDEINFLKEGKGMKNIYAIYNDVANKELNYGGYGYGYYREDTKKANIIDRLFKGSGGRAAV